MKPNRSARRKPRGTVTIPQAPLAADLARAEAIKREMAAMLQELDHLTPHWRHHPERYLNGS